MDFPTNRLENSVVCRPRRTSFNRFSAHPAASTATPDCLPAANRRDPALHGRQSRVEAPQTATEGKGPRIPVGPLSARVSDARWAASGMHGRGCRRQPARAQRGLVVVRRRGRGRLGRGERVNRCRSDRDERRFEADRVARWASRRIRRGVDSAGRAEAHSERELACGADAQIRPRLRSPYMRWRARDQKIFLGAARKEIDSLSRACPVRDSRTLGGSVGCGKRDEHGRRAQRPAERAAPPYSARRLGV